MMIPYFLCMCLLLTLSRGICSKIFVSIGMSISLFTNVTEDEHVALYKNGNDNSTLFAMWKIKDGKITVRYNASDKIRMVYTATYDIWIFKIDQNDQGKYFILYGTNVTGPEANLIIRDGLESDLEMKDNFMLFIFGVAGLIAGLISGMIIMIILICSYKKSQDWLWKMVFRTYLEKLTVKQVGMDIQKWLKNHKDFNYNPDEHLPTGGPHHSDYGIVQSGHYEAEDQKQMKIEDFMATFSPYLAVEEINPLLREGQAADQSSGPQQHEEHLPPPCFPCSSNLVLDSNEVSSSEA